jgi:hypothetical protein
MRLFSSLLFCALPVLADRAVTVELLNGTQKEFFLEASHGSYKDAVRAVCAVHWPWIGSTCHEILSRKAGLACIRHKSLRRASPRPSPSRVALVQLRGVRKLRQPCVRGTTNVMIRRWGRRRRPLGVPLLIGSILRATLQRSVLRGGLQSSHLCAGMHPWATSGAPRAGAPLLIVYTDRDRDRDGRSRPFR